MKKRLIMALLSFAMVCTTVNMATVKANAMTEEEIIAILQQQGALRKTTGGTGVPAPGHEYGGSYELFSQVAKEETDTLVRQRAAERGLTVGEYLEQTGQTCPPSSPNAKLLNTVPSSGNSSSTETAAPSHTHSYTEEVTKEPACNETGTKTYTCECGKSYTEEMARTDHVYAEEVTKEPTCSEIGEKTFTCRCGDTYVEEIPVGDHEKGAVKTMTEATCTENGRRQVYCKFCGTVLETEEVMALGHEAGEWQTETEAGWFTPGEKAVRCIHCDEILEKEVIPVNTTRLYVLGGVVVAVIGIAVVAIVVVRKNNRK